MKIDESNDLNDNDTKEGDGRNNLAFLQLATLCKSYHNYLNTKNLISNPNDESTISGIAEFLLIAEFCSINNITIIICNLYFRDF